MALRGAEAAAGAVRSGRLSGDARRFDRGEAIIEGADLARPRLIILARHAQSEHHVRRLTGGWTDTPLTALGHEQAALLAARLASELGGAAVAVYTSDLLRASQTAVQVGRALGVEPTSDVRLREFNNGDAANMTIEEARVAFPAADEPWRVDDRPYPGAETFREFFARVGGFLDALADDGRVPVIVAHGGTVECLIARWLSLSPEVMEPIGFASHPTGITTLTRSAWERATVERVNDVSHLAGTAAAPVLRDLLPLAPAP